MLLIAVRVHDLPWEIRILRFKTVRAAEKSRKSWDQLSACGPEDSRTKDFSSVKQFSGRNAAGSN